MYDKLIDGLCDCLQERRRLLTSDKIEPDGILATRYIFSWLSRPIRRAHC